LVALHDHLERVSGSGVICVDTLALVSRVRGTCHWAWSIHTPSVLAAFAEVDLNLGLWEQLCSFALNLQVHAPTLCAVCAPGANLVAIHFHLEGVSGTSVIGVDAVPSVSSVYLTSHWTWCIHTPSVATASSNDHIDWFRQCRLLFWSIRLDTRNLQIHAPTPSLVSTASTDLVTIHFDIK
jgi:hypothetical protein